MPVKQATKSVKKMNHRKAECKGHYGYGNGRERKDFCRDICPISRKCWRQTVATGITKYFPASDVLPFNSLIAKWMRKYPDRPIKARRLALKESIEKGKYDPYLQIVVINTQRGVQDSSASYLPFKGGVWFYHGAIVAYHA